MYLVYKIDFLLLIYSPIVYFLIFSLDYGLVLFPLTYIFYFILLTISYTSSFVFPFVIIFRTVLIWVWMSFHYVFLIDGFSTVVVILQSCCILLFYVINSGCI